MLIGCLRANVGDPHPPPNCASGCNRLSIVTTLCEFVSVTIPAGTETTAAILAVSLNRTGVAVAVAVGVLEMAGEEMRAGGKGGAAAASAGRSTRKR